LTIYRKIIFNLLTALFISGSVVYAQLKTDIGIINRLVNRSVETILAEETGKNASMFLEYNSAPGLEFLRDRVALIVSNLKFEVVESENEADFKLKYSLEEAYSVYLDTFKDGFWGGYFVERETIIGGTYSLVKGSQVIHSDNINSTVIDTLDYENALTLGKSSSPFTRGDVPPEPFFSNIWGPVLAIGATAVAIFLFFSVRSK